MKASVDDTTGRVRRRFWGHPLAVIRERYAGVPREMAKAGEISSEGAWAHLPLSTHARA